MTTKAVFFQPKLDTLNGILNGLNDQHATIDAFERRTNQEWNQFRNRAATAILKGIKDWSRREFDKSWLKDTLKGIPLQNLPTTQGIIDFLNQLEKTVRAQSYIDSLCDNLISELEKTDIPATETPTEYVRRRLQELGVLPSESRKI
jgi:hypothetical protein